MADNSGLLGTPLHLLIVCADPTSIKQQKGLQIAQSLLPKRRLVPTYSGKFPITSRGKKQDFFGVHQKDYAHLLPLDEVLLTPLKYQAILFEYCPLAIRNPNVDILLSDEVGNMVFYFIKAVIRLPLNGFLIMTTPIPLDNMFAGPGTRWIHSILKYFQKINTDPRVSGKGSSWGLWQKTADPTEREVFEQVGLRFVNKTGAAGPTCSTGWGRKRRRCSSSSSSSTTTCCDAAGGGHA